MVTPLQLAAAVLEGKTPREFLKGLPKKNFLKVGESVSHGTLNPRDLIEAFLDTLRVSDQKEYISLWSDQELQDYLNAEMPHDEARDFEDTYLHEVLWNEMQNLCPPMTYFGSHPGDGSDFGCWPYEAHDYEDLAAEGRIDYAKEGDQEMAERIRTGQLQGDARYGVIQLDHYTYECYDANGRQLWRY